MSEDLAKRRFFILQALRFFGAGMAFFGAAIIAGKTSLPAAIGYVFLVFGAIDATIVPVVIARLWKSKDK